MIQEQMATLHYVGFGGRDATVSGSRVNLGVGVRRSRRGWLWHFCFGYVSGFPVSAIFYYLLTRHTTKRMAHWYWKREHEAFTASTGQPWDKCHAEGCKRPHKAVAS